jgi:ribosomal protein S18 acetylase RimI-like enzyme
MNIRPAVASDARTVATVHVQTWQSAFRGIVPDAYRQSWLIDGREAVRRDAIDKGTPQLWVAERDSQVIGASAPGASRDEDAGPHAGEIRAIHLLPQYWSTGVGRALGLTSRRRLVERGFDMATLGVLAANVRAIRCYTAAGFAPNPGSEKQISRGDRALCAIRCEMALGRAG